MRYMAALAIAFFGMGNAAGAQHGGATRGSFSARPSGVSSGVFGTGRAPGNRGLGPQFQRFPAPFGFMPPFAGNRFQAAGQGYGGAWPSPRPGYSASAPWRPTPGRSNTRIDGQGGYGTSYPFLQPTSDPCFSGCLDLFADPNVAGADTSSWSGASTPDSQTSGASGYASGYGSSPYNAQATPYAAQVPDPSPTLYSSPYPTQPAYLYGGIGVAQPIMQAPRAPGPRPSNPPEEEETVTLLFKDGRPPLQVRNYILTRSAIYLTGKHFNEILLSDIDLQATQKVNWDAGVTFRLP